MGVGTVADVLLPTCCPVCRRVGEAPCRRCRSTLRAAPHLPAPPGVDQCVALVAFEGAAAVAIRRLKYHNHRDALVPFARALARLVEREVGTRAFDHLTWVPAAPTHRRERGYDQGRLVAVAVGADLGLAPERLLVRDPGGSQTGRSLAERLGGPELRARPGTDLAGTVLVVDDVRTSGASLARAAGALRSAGAAHVVAATLAATPDRSAS